ncbi:MAG TPA: ATP-binding protein [Steroidobacteraceae bacterium]|nr:ATP-binding protein [Steroidobacteraceae bacterium]
MDDSTLEALRKTLRAAPHSRELALIVIRACLERGDAARTREILEEARLDARAWPESERRELARAWLLAAVAERAIEVLEGEEPETAILRAQVLSRTGDLARGLAEYRAAVKANPALEDRALEARLTAQVVQFDAARRAAARKVTQDANDDTDASEVVRLLMPELERVTFADVGGLDDIKKQIHRRIILPFQKPSLFQRFRRKAGGGILLYGPPGCGKTLIARATAGECGAHFYNVAVSDILDMYIGESERKLHELFEQARRSVPAVLFFDEVEALGGKRQYSREATSSKLVSQFLSELDGFAQNNQNVLVMAATNVPWAVDPAFRRPGRFDRVMFVPPPDRAARESILARLLQERPTAGALACREIAELTPGFSGADLRDLVDTAVDEAIEASISSGRECPVQMDHLRAALKEAKATTTEWLTTARNYARYANEGGQYDEVLEFLERHGARR